MIRIALLDSGPVGLATLARGKPAGDAFRAWLDGIEAAGYVVMVPEVADYEVRRELLRLGATAGLRRLDALDSRFAYLPITTAAMLRAAELWAMIRRVGLPRPGRMSWTPTPSSPVRRPQRATPATR